MLNLIKKLVRLVTVSICVHRVSQYLLHSPASSSSSSSTLLSILPPFFPLSRNLHLTHSEEIPGRLVISEASSSSSPIR